MTAAAMFTPTPEAAAATELAAFARLAEARHGVGGVGGVRGDYAALHAWSIREPAEFWPLLWDFLGVIGDRGGRALEPGRPIDDPRFFPDARLSFAENLVKRRDDATAIVALAADGARRTLTFAELARETARVAGGLRALGVAPGDRVAAILPNAADAVVAMLAANSLGAIWSLCDPEMGDDAIIDRFGQIEPAVLIAAGAAARVAALHARLPTARHLIARDDLAAFGDPAAVEPAFLRVPFATPAFILYTSGTTGLPKCIVHNTGGQLLQLAKELRIHYDLRAGDRFFYQTSTGWNMWYWVVIALAVGATVILREGSPIRPRPDALFAMVDAERVTHFGVSPAYLAQIKAAKLRPRTAFALDSIRAVLSTGSPLSPALYDYVYADLKPDAPVISLSGGTEINACFVTGNPMAPVYRGEIQAPALGMATAVFDDAGREITLAKGELVCTAPFPSQPVGLWNDPGRARYLATYFERYPGAWHHGDFAETTAHGGYVIHGRSDATLKPSGHRIGTAEIYRQLEPIDAIADAVAVGQRWNDDVRIVLFVVLRPGHALTTDLERTIRTAIFRNTSAHHVPARIVAVADLPMTRTGKKAELAVRQVIHGEPVANVAALANPESLALFSGLPQLAR
jgi:acetoacetyl-CoA synthetase